MDKKYPDFMLRVTRSVNRNPQIWKAFHPHDTNKSMAIGLTLQEAATWTMVKYFHPKALIAS